MGIKVENLKAGDKVEFVGPSHFGDNAGLVVNRRFNIVRVFKTTIFVSDPECSSIRFHVPFRNGVLDRFVATNFGIDQVKSVERSIINALEKYHTQMRSSPDVDAPMTSGLHPVPTTDSAPMTSGLHPVPTTDSKELKDPLRDMGSDELSAKRAEIAARLNALLAQKNKKGDDIGPKQRDDPNKSIRPIRTRPEDTL